jgi:hypothetical protein
MAQFGVGQVERGGPEPVAAPLDLAFTLPSDTKPQLRDPTADGHVMEPQVFPGARGASGWDVWLGHVAGTSGWDVRRPARALRVLPSAYSGYWAGVVVWLRFRGVVQVRVPGLGVVRVQPGVCLH